MLTGRIVKQVDIPHEPGEWLKLRLLPGKKLDEARELKQRQTLAGLREMGVDIWREFTAERGGDSPATQDPLTYYDVDTLLRAGIVGWSYEEKVTPQAIEDLDAQTRRWAAETLLQMVEESAEARKNA